MSHSISDCFATPDPWASELQLFDESATLHAFPIDATAVAWAPEGRKGRGFICDQEAAAPHLAAGCGTFKAELGGTFKAELGVYSAK